MTPIVTRPATLALLVLVLAFAGCASSTKLADHWSDPSWQAVPMRNVYVIAVRNSGTHRRIWEDGFVAQLRVRGVGATASYFQFPDAVPDTQQVIAAVRAGGYDGVLVSLRLPTEQEKREIPPLLNREMDARRGPATGYYDPVYNEPYLPGSTETDEVRRFQTDIWTTHNGGRLVWSGTVRIYDPVTSDLVTSVISTQILPEASRDGMFPVAPKN